MFSKFVDTKTMWHFVTYYCGQLVKHPKRYFSLKHYADNEGSILVPDHVSFFQKAFYYQVDTGRKLNPVSTG